MKLAVTLLSFVFGTVAFAQVPYPIALQPGDYRIQDTSKILDSTIRFAGYMLGQDTEMYNKIVKESREAYEALYGSCSGAGTNLKCTGFNELRRMSVLTTRVKTVVSFRADEIFAAQQAYVTARDLLAQQLAAIETTKAVWDGVVSSNQSEAVKTEYKKAALNFDKLTKVYKDGISQMEAQATKFQYKFSDGTGVKTSAENMGLEAPNATETAEVLKAELEQRQKSLKFSADEQDAITAVIYNMVTQMLNFRDSAGQKLIFFTNGQDANNSGWIKNIQDQARLLKWVRGNFCMPLGAPGVDVPAQTATNQFTIFLNRDISKIFQPRQAVVKDPDALREMKNRMERIFLSLQSQNGEFSSVGGVMSYVHRVNSTFSWHNQTAANISVMKIIQNMIDDELDLQAFDSEGCNRVRARYQQAYGSFGDVEFLKVVDRYLGGIIAGGAPNDIVGAFVRAGQGIRARGKIALEIKKYLKQHPAASPFGDLVDPDLK